MITNVEMNRTLFDLPIKQRTKDSYFSATDLAKACNKWRVSQGLDYLPLQSYFLTKSSKEFINQLNKEENCETVIIEKGRGKNTWVHPFIFLDIALWYSPRLKTKMYRWIYDDLIKYRNNSGDSYKKMCGALYITQSNKSNYEKDIILLALRIQKEVGVDDWQKATQEQLKLRDKIHENIALLSDIIRDRETLYEVSIRKAKEEILGKLKD